MSSDDNRKLAIGASVGTIVLAVGSYYGLSALAGGKKVEQASKAITPDAVFAADINSAPAESSALVEEAAPAPTIDESAASTDTTAADASTDTAAVDSTSADTASADSSVDPTVAAAEAAVSAVGDGGGALSADDARRIGEEVARQVAAQVAQQIVDQQLSKSSGGGSAGLTADEARQIGQEEGRRVAEEVARSVVASAPSGGGGGGMTAEEAEQIGLAAGRRAAKQVAARTARAIVREQLGSGTVVASAGSGSGSDSNSSSGSAEPASNSSEPAAPRAARASSGTGSSADALKAWWPAPSGSDFGLVYAGQPKGEPAIALLFSTAPNTGALGEGVKVYDEQGQVVAGSWEAAANPRLVVFRGVKPGRYTVVVAPSLADSAGKTIAQPAHGPVYVTT